MKKGLTLTGKIIFFSIVLVIFGAIPAFIIGNWHKGIAGAPSSGAYSDIKTIAALGALIVIPILLIILTGWVLFGKPAVKKKS